MATGHELIVSDPGIMGGKPAVRGTRLTVELILRKLGSGLSVEELLAAYPDLTAEDVLAAQRFAADHLAAEEIIWDRPAAE